MEPVGLDIISISGLKLEARIGTTEEERSSAQPIELSIDVGTDTREAAVTRRVSDTVCYSDLAEAVSCFVQEEEWMLLEELLQQLCAFIFEHYPLAEEISIEGRKFVVPDTNWVGVRIFRRRESR